MVADHCRIRTDVITHIISLSILIKSNFNESQSKSHGDGVDWLIDHGRSNARSQSRSSHAFCHFVWLVEESCSLLSPSGQSNPEELGGRVAIREKKDGEQQRQAGTGGGGEGGGGGVDRRVWVPAQPAGGQPLPRALPGTLYHSTRAGADRFVPPCRRPCPFLGSWIGCRIQIQLRPCARASS